MSVKPLPKWAMRKYALLWRSFKTAEFDYDSASRILTQQNSTQNNKQTTKPNKNLTSVLLNSLRKNGWLTAKLHPIDARKRIYALKSPEQITEEMAQYAANKAQEDSHKNE
jgi:hypothetical protein